MYPDVEWLEPHELKAEALLDFYLDKNNLYQFMRFLTVLTLRK